MKARAALACVQKVRGAIPFDAVQQINFPREIGIHRRFSILRLFVRLEPDVNWVIGHFAVCRERIPGSDPNGVAALKQAYWGVRQSASFLRREVGEQAIL